MSRHASPTAQLLRTSRLFSLPQALPRPIIEQHVRDGNFRSSDSATTPYPLRQAIITPNSSAHRGDWGLKRSLPKRAASRSSEPMHGVAANDTYESVTDYHSASPHVKTLQRFQELNVAMTRQDQKTGTSDGNISAMEPSLDFTDEKTGGNRRWKYDGGSVRSMTPAEFDQYLRKTVAHRKDEFMLQLRARAHLQQLEEQREGEKKQMQEAPLDGEETAPIDSVAFVAKSAYTDWLLRLRDAKEPILAQYLEQTRRILESNRLQPEAVDEILNAAYKFEATEKNAETILAEQEAAVSGADGGNIALPNANEQILKSSFTDLAAFTYSAALRYALREKWWTHELEDDRSPEGELLKQKLQQTITPAASLAPVTRPALGAAASAAWLNYLSLVEKLEHAFLRAWITKEWDPSGTHFTSILQTLRKDSTLLSPLSKLVRQFLDMPPNDYTALRREFADKNLPGLLAKGEPAFSLTTHPTAGLSYLRSNKIINNHPILGPQRNDPPVKARVIGKFGSGNTLYGVAGFVAQSESGAQAMDLTRPGGGKGERRIKNVYVNGEGRVNVTLEQSKDNEALSIREGGLAPNDQDRARQAPGSNLIGILRVDGAARSRDGAARRAPRARPLANEAVSKLTELQKMIEGGEGFAPKRS